MHYILNKKLEEKFNDAEYSLEKGTKLIEINYGLYLTDKKTWICDMWSPIFKEYCKKVYDSTSDVKIKEIVFKNGIKLNNVFISCITGTDWIKTTKVFLQFNEFSIINYIKEYNSEDLLTFTNKPQYNINKIINDDITVISGFKVNDIKSIKFDK